MELTTLENRLTCDSFEQERSYFLAYLSVKGRKETTIRTYKEALSSVHRTLLDMGHSGSIRSLTPDDCVQLRGAMTVSETSKKLYLVVVSRLQECFGQDSSVKKADLLWNRCDHRRLFIRPEEFKVMMTSCDEREKLVMMLGAYMGLRRSEICSIRLEDVTGNVLTVHGKGHGTEGKVMHMKIPRPVLLAIDGYMRVRTGSDDHLMLTPDGRPMCSAYLGRLVGRIAKREGVTMTPHSLRRLFATTLYETGADLETIRRLMRHNSVTTTVECYINANPVVQDNAVDALCAALA